MEADLYCIHCKEDVPHSITYINDKLTHVGCEICGKSVDVEINPTREFYKEVYKRVSSKPARITEEYKQDLSHFLLSIPKRVISKPYRLMKDLHESRKIIRELHDQQKDIN